ncbi:hypothetical protein M758_3G192400 [Ceratodon purpureus]|nr:hypothetical protein M758_3G192400 [Ceratodon purpureus]
MVDGFCFFRFFFSLLFVCCFLRLVDYMEIHDEMRFGCWEWDMGVVELGLGYGRCLRFCFFFSVWDMEWN